MWKRTIQAALLRAGERDAKPTGQMPAPARPPSGFPQRPASHSAGAPLGARAAGVGVGRRDRRVRSRASDRPVTPDLR
jgi:hypothetical protein